MSKPKTAVTPHPFRADPETPADPVSGDQVCRCGLVGRAGDSHHDMPVVLEQRAHQRRYEPGADDA